MTRFWVALCPICKEDVGTVPAGSGGGRSPTQAHRDVLYPRLRQHIALAHAQVPLETQLRLFHEAERRGELIVPFGQYLKVPRVQESGEGERPRE